VAAHACRSQADDDQRQHGHGVGNQLVYDRDPDFFKLYRMPQAYRASLAQTNSTVAVSPGSEFLRLLLTAIAPIDIRRQHRD
jgi:hypothetical protein